MRKPARKFGTVSMTSRTIDMSGPHRFGSPDEVCFPNLKPVLPRLAFAKATPGLFSKPDDLIIWAMCWTVQRSRLLILRGRFGIEHDRCFLRIAGGGKLRSPGLHAG